MESKENEGLILGKGAPIKGEKTRLKGKILSCNVVGLLIVWIIMSLHEALVVSLHMTLSCCIISVQSGHLHFNSRNHLPTIDGEIQSMTFWKCHTV